MVENRKGAMLQHSTLAFSIMNRTAANTRLVKQVVIVQHVGAIEALEYFVATGNNRSSVRISVCEAAIEKGRVYPIASTVGLSGAVPVKKRVYQRSSDRRRRRKSGSKSQNKHDGIINLSSEDLQLLIECVRFDCLIQRKEFSIIGVKTECQSGSGWDIPEEEMGSLQAQLERVQLTTAATLRRAADDNAHLRNELIPDVSLSEAISAFDYHEPGCLLRAKSIQRVIVRRMYKLCISHLSREAGDRNVLRDLSRLHQGCVDWCRCACSEKTPLNSEWLTTAIGHLSNQLLRKLEYDNPFMADLEAESTGLTRDERNFLLHLNRVMLASGSETQSGVLEEEPDQEPVAFDRLPAVQARQNSLETVDLSESLHSMLEELQSTFRDTGVDESVLFVFKKLEHIVLFYLLDLPQISTIRVAIPYLYRLVSNVTGISMLDISHHWLKALIESLRVDCETQSGGLLPEWLDECKESEGTNRLLKLFCAMVSLCLTRNAFIGLTDPEGKPLEIGDHLFGRLWAYFKPLIKSRDIVQNLLAFVKWLLCSGVEVLTGKRTLKSIFFERDNAAMFDNRVAKLDSWASKIEHEGDDTLLEYYQEAITLEAIGVREMKEAVDKRLRLAIANQLKEIRKHADAGHRRLQSRCIREQPFAVSLFGGSSVGKTVVTQALVPVLQKAAGVSVDPTKVYHLDMADKYYSGAFADANTYLLDDIANTQLEYTERVASDFVINIINNFRRYAIMADISDKGKIPIEPAVVIGTTNVQDLLSRQTSNEPLAIMRRFNYHVEVKVKPSCGYGPDVNKLMFRTENHNPADHRYNCWNFFVSQVEPDDGAQPFRLVPVEDCYPCEYGKLCRFLAERCRSHTRRQKELVNIMRTVHTQPMCEHNVFAHICDLCVPPIEVQSGREIAVERMNELLRRERQEEEDRERAAQRIAEINSWNVRDGAVWLAGLPGRFRTWTHALQYWWVQFRAAQYIAGIRHGLEPHIRQMYTYMATDRLNATSRRITSAFGTPLGARILLGYYDWRRHGGTWRPPWSALGNALIPAFIFRLLCRGVVSYSTFYIIFVMLRVAIHYVLNVLWICKYVPLSNVDTVSAVVRELRTRWNRDYRPVVMPLTMAVGALAVAYGAWRLTHKSNVSTQGCNVSLPVPSNVTQRRDPWRPPDLEQSYFNVDMATATSQQMSGLLQTKLKVMCFFKDGVMTDHCVTMPVCTGFWIAPYHLMRKEPDTLHVVLYDTDREHSTRIAKAGGSWRRIGETDLCLVYLPQIGDQRNLINLFPTQVVKHKGVGAICVRMKAVKRPLEGTNDQYIHLERASEPVHASSAMITPTDLGFSYMGGRYSSVVPTYRGMCGSVVLADVKMPYILGIHTAGHTGMHEGNYCAVTRQQIQKVIDDMSKVDTAMMQGSESDDYEECLDFKNSPFRFTKAIRPKSAITFTQGGGLSVLGSSTEPMRTFRSSVKPTLVADSIVEKFGVEITHGAPRYINHWAPANAWVSSVSRPCDVPQDLVDTVYKQLREYWLSNLPENWKDTLKPLSEDVILAGKDGVKGCYAMNMATSMGIPLCRPKKEYIVQSNRVVEGISCPRDMPEFLRKSIKNYEERLAQGKRVYFPFRCNRKDEPMKLSKQKVRIFTGGNFEYLYLMRKYFLPFSILMQQNPLLFMCAVGVNAMSVEWTHLGKHIERFGKSRIVAGDFGQYDQKMSVRLMLAAFKLIISFLELAGYDEKSLAICRGLAIETCMAVYNMEGTWLQPNSANPSGHSLTVVVNSICNVILMWCAFILIQMRHNHEQQGSQDVVIQPGFLTSVALMTYGDDNIMSVSEDASYFNHTSIAQVMLEWGIDYTMADKSTESIAYIHMDDAEFLKRKWVWSDVHGRYLCPLLKSSIFKSLTSALVSDVLTREQQAAEIVAGAQREFWFHGRDEFAYATLRLSEIVEDFNIRHHLPTGRLLSYEEIDEWYMES